MPEDGYKPDEVYVNGEHLGTLVGQPVVVETPEPPKLDRDDLRRREVWKRISVAVVVKSKLKKRG